MKLEFVEKIMIKMTFFKLVLFAFCTIVFMNGVFAQAGITDACHCFRQRTFDSEKPFAADDYILTTSFNSLTAAWFGLSKKELIRYKMKGGIKSGDLMIALFLSRNCKVGLEKVLSARQREGEWKKVVVTMPELKTQENNRIINRLYVEKSIVVARDLTDEMLAGFYGLPVTEITGWHRAELDEKEISLLLILEKEKKIPAKKLLEQVRKEGHSWSGIAFYLGISPKEAGRMILAFHKSQF